MQFITDLLPFAFVFAAVALFVFAVGTLLPFSGLSKHRLKGESEQGASHKRILRPEEGAFTKLMALPFGRYLALEEKGQPSVQRLSLIRAGFFSPSAPAIYYVLRTLLAFVLPLVASILFPLFNINVSRGVAIMLVVIPGLFGFMLPTFIVSARTKARQQAAREHFPDALDMLLMCVEAGIGLDEAMIRVSQELKNTDLVLSEHFDQLTSELRAGKTRENAFRTFSDRIGINEIQSFTTLLKQTEELGTSMAASLRSMSDDMRQRRMMRAEEMAQKLSTKLSMLMMTFILPVLLMVIMAPAVIGALHHFKKDSRVESEISRSSTP